MIARRQFLQAVLATAAVLGTGRGRTLAQGTLSQDELLKFKDLGNVTLIHVTDAHGQLMPLHFREPSVNIGVGDAKGLVPHMTGKAFLEEFALSARSPQAYALTDQDFTDLARLYGRMGGFDRIATIIKGIRAARPD